MIRNERRIELCCENFRFWDSGRWNLDLNESAKGVMIDRNPDGDMEYTELPSVEVRNYKDYMIYGPVPYSETQKWSNLIQNRGW